MNDLDKLQPTIQQSMDAIPWAERISDHNRKIDEYLQNCLFRGYSAETTIPRIKSTLSQTLGRVELNDPTHPAGRRHLLFWELLHPEFGAPRLGLIIASLMNDDLAPDTRRHYMNELRYFCEYVIAKPNIPGTSEVTIAQKYGPISLSFSKYDLPVHAQDRPRKSRYALAPTLRDEFYEFLRTEYLPSHALPHIGARNYTAVILQTEIGARVSELLAIQSEGDRRDIDQTKARVRLFGKAKAYGGKRIRWVPLTELAAEVLNVFERVFKPMFPKPSDSDHLFLNADGSRLTRYQFWKALKKMIELARQSGVLVPEDLRAHDLRRTFATNKLEKNPLEYRKVLKMLGHSYPSSAAPYLIATDDDVEEEQADLIDIFVDPYINKRGTK
jgi:site-specific recombinase XerD